ncbi:MAG: hypothetical protein L6R37_006357 [Teloschistes peruensis]|nr:MAG: hypothetical protein L6R37_006357 [Teloschistes peruensis]
MASPIYRSPATSPSYPSSAALPNPKKRPSLSVTSHPPAAKRRKPTNPSQASTPATSHPLRQTSFPPEESAIDTGERSPSVDSNITGYRSAMTSIAGKPPPKKRGRKRKTDQASLISGDKAPAKDASSAAGPLADEPEEDDDEADADDGVSGEQDKEQKRKDIANLSVLVAAFNPDQNYRYEAMRRTKFRKEVLRRIVNQTVSQSVPPSVVTAISGYTKLWVGTLIERARDVQEQNAAAAASYPSPPSRPQSSRTAGASQTTGVSNQETTLPSTSFTSSTTFTPDKSFGTQSPATHHAHPDTDSDTDRPPALNHNDIFGTSSSPPRPPNPPFPSNSSPNGVKTFPSSSRRVESMPLDFSFSTSSPSSQIDSPPRQSKKAAITVNKKQLGPLLPDDFREAVRRFKRDGESAGIGQGGSSLMGIGVKGSIGAGRGRGKRLFG